MLEGLVLEANILPKSGSDHWPIQFWIDTTSAPKFKPFRFEKLWLTHPYFQELSHKWWSEATITHGTLMYIFQQKINNFKQFLRDWNKNVFGNIFQAQRSIEQCLEEIQKEFILQGPTDSLQAEEELLKK
jgi:hypothetical protein